MKAKRMTARVQPRAARKAKPGLLSPEDLGRLASALAKGTDPERIERLKERIERGFYGS